jgi:hypothetical protein
MARKSVVAGFRKSSLSVLVSMINLLCKTDSTLSVKLSDISVFYALSLAPQPSLGLGLLHKIRLSFLEASQQFSILQGRVVSPTPNSHPGGPDLCIIYIPQR